MDWILSFGVITGNFIIGRKIAWGWVLMALVALGWIYYAIWILSPIQWGLVPSAAINLVISLISAYRWFTEDKQ